MKLAIQNLIDFLSNIFLTQKSNGGHRFILNLKQLNKFISNAHFKMEDHRTASKMIPNHGFMATIDLKESYLLVPVSKSDRKYLSFQYDKITFEFSVLPYGLCSAPRTFTKIMKEVVGYQRHRGFRSVIYLDDWLCLGDSYDECQRNVTETLKLLNCLGFVVNFDKSCLYPQQCCKFLGFMYNSVDMSISLPSDKRHKILQFSRLPVCTIREFAHLLEVLTSACPAVKYGWLYTKELERQKYVALLKHQTYEAKFKPSASILPDLKWWLKNIRSYTNIHYLELLAVFLGIKCFARECNNCSTLLRVDNTTAISYIYRMGGIQFPHLTKTIWQWCEKRNIWLFASYINTKDNRSRSGI